MNDNVDSILINTKNIINKNHIAQTGSSFGFYRNYILERHMWIYELICQFQNKCTGHSILKGGACTQLYLPLKFQRCTADIDFITDLSIKNIEKILTEIKTDFSEMKISIDFKEYKPLNVKKLPMVTYILTVPFHYRPSRKKQKFDIKFDFLFIDDVNNLFIDKIENPETFGIKMSYSPLCTSAPMLISDKLLTFAINSIGIDFFKLDSFYKNIYDLYYLLITLNDFDTFHKASLYINNSINMEFLIKDIPKISTNKIFNDILKTLFYFSVVDLTYEKKGQPKKLKLFEKYYLQSSINYNLNSDMWSIMSIYLYLWANGLKKYINKNNFSGLDKLNLLKKDCDNYNLLSSKQKNKYIKKLKTEITLKNKLLNLSSINNPIRIIYIYYLVCK